jgi:hypothetical protein
MKKINFVMLALLLSVSSYYAQLSKGTFMPGIGINYSYNSSKSHDTINAGGLANDNASKSTNFSTNIKLGYFISDKVVIGVLGGYSSQTYDNTWLQNNTYSYDRFNTNNGIYGGVFLRYYKLMKNNKFGFFGQLSSNYTFGKTRSHSTEYNINSQYYYDSETHGTSGTFNASISPGIVYFISNKVGVEAMFGNIGFNSQNNKSFSKYNQVGTGSSNSFYTNFSLTSLQLGVNFYFGKNKTEVK